jgi:hypothetical protein
MEKSTSSTTRSTRKRKQSSVFSPPSHQEEKEITRALQLSLRKIPSDDEISEDESEHGEGDLQEEVVDDFESDVQSESKQYETKWDIKIQEIQVNNFNLPSGPTKTLPSTQGVKNFFELMFTRKVWNHVCKQTNIYAKQQMLLNPDIKWEPLTVGELKAWVGCLIAMGLNQKNNIRMYWEPVWRLSVVADRFTENRFMAIKKYLHLADNSVIAENKTLRPDRLAKIRPFLNLLLTNFRSNYRPSRILTVDEDMCKFKGRNAMKQYMKAKIIKWGYRFWKLCDASSAYTLNLDVYTGATEEKKEQGLAYAVVMKMMDQYLDKNHVVVMDNFFTSVPLFLDLLAKSTYACGTIRLNRKFLPEEYGKSKDLSAGDHLFWQSGNLVATIWQDKKAVRLLSTCCAPEGTDSVKRRRRNQGTIELSCPPSLKLYTKHMGGVDRSDRMVRTYSVSRRSKKWWYRLFYYLVDTSIANSFILYHNSDNHPKITELEFVKQLSLALIGTFSKKDKVQPHPQRKRTKVRTPPRLTAGNHWPKNAKKQQQCQHCALPGKKGPRSRYICKACKVHLCLDGCFELYHTRR